MSANVRHSAVVQELRQRLRQMDRAGALSVRAGALSSTGVAPLDALLPAGAFRSGMIVEWIVEGAGSGASRLALPMVLEALRPPDERVAGAGPKGSPGERLEDCACEPACLIELPAKAAPVFSPSGASLRSSPGHPRWISSGEATGEKCGALVIIDERREFYPPAAVSLGLDLGRTIVVRPRNHQETIWALEQSLHCAGVAATLGWIGKISDRVFRRFQLAAEHGAGLGIFMRPAEVRHEPSWADVRWLVQALPTEANSWRRREEASPMQDGAACRQPKDVLCEGGFSLDEGSSGRRVRVELLHCRGGTGGGAVILEISDETGAVSVVPPLAPPANLSRAAGA